MNPVMTIRIWTLGAFVESQVPKEHFNELLDWLVSHRSTPEKSETAIHELLDSKRKAAHERLEKARLEMHAATEAAREFEAICRHCGEKESEHASGAQICIGGGGSQFSPVWTPESGEPCPMEESCTNYDYLVRP